MSPDTPTQAALPDLPQANHSMHALTGYTADQMRAYARQALQEACAERDALRQELLAYRVQEQVLRGGIAKMAGVLGIEPAAPDADALRANLATASVFEIGSATVERAKQRDGSYLWAARSESGLCLNRSGEWEYEPMPSSRDDDFLFRCRFATAEEAAAAITNARKEGA